MSCDFQQCGIMTRAFRVDSNEPEQPPVKLKKLKMMLVQ